MVGLPKASQDLAMSALKRGHSSGPLGSRYVSALEAVAWLPTRERHVSQPSQESRGLCPEVTSWWPDLPWTYRALTRWGDDSSSTVWVQTHYVPCGPLWVSHVDSSANVDLGVLYGYITSPPLFAVRAWTTRSRVC